MKACHGETLSLLNLKFVRKFTFSLHLFLLIFIYTLPLPRYYISHIGIQVVFAIHLLGYLKVTTSQNKTKLSRNN